MASDPATFLFGSYTIAAAVRGRSRYAHTFGGPHDREGTSRSDCDGIHIHLLYRFDLTDPAIPIAVPGIRWLPLYYCFDFRANTLGYRLTADDALVAYFPDDENVASKEKWPDDDYPLEFSRSKVKIEECFYDPTDPEDAWTWAGVFGISKLSEADQATVRRRAADLMDGLGLEVPETEEEFDAALSNPFVQGKPDGRCLNPTCPNHRREGQLSVIALMPAEPIKGVHTFGRWGGGVQLIFQICPKCHTIRVDNECT